MKSKEQLTSVKKINETLKELERISVKISLLKGGLNAVNLKMALLFSEDCSECGEHQKTIYQMRNSLRVTEDGISNLETAVNWVANRIDPDNSFLNKDYYK